MSLNYIFLSVPSFKLKKNQIKSICLLKDQSWKYGIKKQKDWYKHNVKKKDLHNLFYIKSKLVGYTLLRKRTYKIKNHNKLLNYFLFDTLIIDKEYRGRKLSFLMMHFNNSVIKKYGYLSFLNCKNKFVAFYKKFNWKKLNNHKFSSDNNLFYDNAMIFNKKLDKKKYYFYISK